MKGAKRFIALANAVICITFLTQCANPKAGRTRLAPTPVDYHQTPHAERLHHVDHSETIPVFIVSSRNVDPKAKGPDPFGDSRVDGPAPQLAIGQVAVGSNGQSKKDIISDTLRENGRDGVTRFELRDVERFQAQGHYAGLLADDGDRSDHPWIAAINRELAKSVSKQITIYVHGYNTQFIKNTELAAEISHFKARDGAVISFDWPSEGRLSGYLIDKGNAIYSTRHFRNMVKILADETDAQQINILAHSAGNPIVVNALRELRLADRGLSPEELQQKYKISSVALAAPDMDLQTFVNAVFDRFHDTTHRVAVYTSQKDKALQLSSFLFDATRLGKASTETTTWEDEVLSSESTIQMIDVTSTNKLDRDPLGHSYFHRNPIISRDIDSFMRGVPPLERDLVREPDSQFWTFPASLVTEVGAQLKGKPKAQ